MRFAIKPPPKKFSRRPSQKKDQESPTTPDLEPEPVPVEVIADAVEPFRPKPVPPTSSRLIVKRGGHSITRQIPKPIIVIDTRERMPFSFGRFPNWIAGEERKTLRVGDYTVAGMEKLLILERKSLTDLITTLMQQRPRFFEMCEKMAKFRWRALIVEASYEEVKTVYPEELNTMAHPNAVSGSLDALEAKFGIPVIYASSYRPLAEEKAASWLSKHFTYWHLEQAGLGRVLQEGDL